MVRTYRLWKERRFLSMCEDKAQHCTLDEVWQRPERTELGDKPDDKAIIRSTRKAKSKKSPGDSTYKPNFGKR